MDQFEQIVLKYQNLVYTVCLNIVGDSHEAENIAQETFISAYQSLSSQRGDNLKAWICRIAVNKSIDFKRKNARYELVDDIEPYVTETDNSLERIVEQKALHRHLEEVLSGLPDKYSDVVRAFYYRRKSVQEIAEAESTPPKTIETRLYRARKLIKERWGDYEL